MGRFVARYMAVREMRKLATSIAMCAASVTTAVEFDRTPPVEVKEQVISIQRLIQLNTPTISMTMKTTQTIRTKINRFRAA